MDGGAEADPSAAPRAPIPFWPALIPGALFCFQLFGFNPVLGQFLNQVGGSGQCGSVYLCPSIRMRVPILIRAVAATPLPPTNAAGVRPAGRVGLRRPRGQRGRRPAHEIRARARGGVGWVSVAT